MVIEFIFFKCKAVYRTIITTKRLPEKTRLRNDLLCVEWDVKLYSLTAWWVWSDHVQ